MLTSLKDQISSAIVKNILRNLEQTQSSYANAFYALQKDITKVMYICMYSVPYMYKFSRDVILEVFVVNWPSVKFSSSKFHWQTLTCMNWRAGSIHGDPQN